LKPHASTLIVGAGTGNDIAAGIRSGVKEIDAVELDPVIIRLGKEFHPEHPYLQPGVRAICDDARDYFAKCKKKYGLILFSKLDSYAVNGPSSSVRLDNFVYTKESFGDTLKLLEPDGLLVVSYNAARPWFTSRLYATLSAAAGYSPLVFVDKRNSEKNSVTYMLAGDAVRDGRLVIPDELKSAVQVLKPNQVSDRILTDDWPFLYLSPAMIDMPYFLVVMEFIAISLLAGGRLFTGKQEPGCWQMFFLGAAFMLLELQSIARLSLIYGSTWQTSALVINAILIVILIANLFLISLSKPLSMGKVYTLLFAALFVSYFVSVEQMRHLFDGALAAVLGILVAVLPIFCAALIFGSCFAKTKLPARALAFNLFGAVVGALLEYLSNFFGVRDLILVAVVLYGCSYFFMSKELVVPAAVDPPPSVEPPSV
jgi:hypothetical protein